MTTDNASTQVPVLTVRQPWADLIMSGQKPVENRTWPVPSTLPQWRRCPCGDSRYAPGEEAHHLCHFRDDGPFPFRLGIHAGKQEADHDFGTFLAWSQVYGDAYGGGDRLGALLGFVTVTGCHHADECRHIVINHDADGHRYVEADETCSPQWAEPDTWHWTLTGPQPLDEPIPMKGRLGLWWTDDPSMAAV